MPPPIPTLSAETTRVRAFAEQVRAEMHKTLVGQEELIDMLLVAVLSEGHILLEGVPGTAKTLAIRTLAAVFQVAFARIQFTPDLMPSDIIGTNVFDPRTGEFHLKQGPLFAGLVLADEVNRTPPKTQSALLEAMEERQVTIDGVSHALPSPFLVCATQNPIEYEGTYPLPEAQLDRFMLKVVIGYPSKEEEKLIIRQNMAAESPKVNQVVRTEDIIKARGLVREVYMDEKIEKYIVDIVFATRHPKQYNLGRIEQLISYGGSPRASINLALASKAYAFIKRRGYVIPEDVRAVCHDVMRHRVGITYEAEAENVTSESLINEILNTVEVP